MTTLERIDNFRRLWRAILPKTEKRVPSSSSGLGTVISWPDDARFGRAFPSDDDVIEHGLKRLRTKILQGESHPPIPLDGT